MGRWDSVAKRIATPGRPKVLFGIAAFLIIALAAGVALLLDRQTRQARPEPMSEELAAREAEAQETILSMTRDGILRRVDYGRRAVWVEPVAWADASRDQKVALIETVATCMRVLTGSDWVTIRSNSDDTRLGVYAEAGPQISR